MMYDIKVPLEENFKGTAQQKGETIRNGKIIHFEKKNVSNARSILAWGIKANCHEQIVPFEGAVFLRVTFVYSIKDRKKWGQPKTSRPDCDNLVKLLQDVLTDLCFYKDDSQITHLEVRKMYGENPCVYVHMEEHEIWRTWAK